MSNTSRQFLKAGILHKFCIPLKMYVVVLSLGRLRNAGAFLLPIADTGKTAGSSLCLSEKLIPERMHTLTCWPRRKKAISTKFNVCIPLLNLLTMLCSTVYATCASYQQLLVITKALLMYSPHMI